MEKRLSNSRNKLMLNVEERSCLVDLLLFILLILIPSTGQVQKYLGNAGVALYVFVGLLSFLAIYKHGFPKVVSVLTDRQALLLTMITFLGLIAVFAVVYPIVNSGIVGGGSDRDDALNIAALELTHGHYPYYAKTYLGNLISPFPGAIILAVPFVLLLGNSAFQNFFWLLAFATTLRYLTDARRALLVLWTMLIFSPVILKELLVGGDLISNGIYVPISLMLIIRFASTQSKWSPFRLTSTAILLGICLSSRANFVLLLPLVFSALVQASGWRYAAKCVALAGATLCAVTIPFYAYDPQGFVPLGKNNPFTDFQMVLPFAGFIIPLITGLLALALCFSTSNRDIVPFLRNCAIIEAFPVFSALVLSSIKAGKLDFTFAEHGLAFLFFGVLASCPSLFPAERLVTETSTGV